MKTAHKTDKSNNFDPSKPYVYATEENDQVRVRLNGKKDTCAALVCTALVFVAKAIGGDVCQNISRLADCTIASYKESGFDNVEEP